MLQASLPLRLSFPHNKSRHGRGRGSATRPPRGSSVLLQGAGWASAMVVSAIPGWPLRTAVRPAMTGFCVKGVERGWNHSAQLIEQKTRHGRGRGSAARPPRGASELRTGARCLTRRRGVGFRNVGVRGHWVAGTHCRATGHDVDLCVGSLSHRPVKRSTSCWKRTMWGE